MATALITVVALSVGFLLGGWHAHWLLRVDARHQARIQRYISSFDQEKVIIELPDFVQSAIGEDFLTIENPWL